MYSIVLALRYPKVWFKVDLRIVDFLIVFEKQIIR